MTGKEIEVTEVCRRELASRLARLQRENPWCARRLGGWLAANTNSVVGTTFGGRSPKSQELEAAD